MDGPEVAHADGLLDLRDPDHLVHQVGREDPGHLLQKRLGHGPEPLPGDHELGRLAPEVPSALFKLEHVEAVKLCPALLLGAVLQLVKGRVRLTQVELHGVGRRGEAVDEPDAVHVLDSLVLTVRL